MQVLRWLVVFALTIASISTTSAEETGVRARHMFAMGDESILLSRGSLRKKEQPN
eukprot:jgi/Phyca11/559046/estExt2_Genewise1.C_PHYCAscaffold_20989